MGTPSLRTTRLPSKAGTLGAGGEDAGQVEGVAGRHICYMTVGLGLTEGAHHLHRFG